MHPDFTAAFQSLKILLDLLHGIEGLPNSKEIVTALNDVQTKLISANASALASQEKQSQLSAQVRELETHLRTSNDWNTQMQSYELVEFPTKALAFKLKTVTTDGVPMHYLCTACADKKKMTTLQPRKRFLHCPECKSLIAVQRPLTSSSCP